MKQTFAQAAQGFAELVDRLPDGSWSRPGLGVWDLRSLVGHASRSLITVDTYLDRPAENEDLRSATDYLRSIEGMLSADSAAVDERGRAAGAALGADPAASIRKLVDRVLARVEAAEDPLIETIAGGMRLSSYLPTRTFELVVHSLDIARAVDLAAPSWPEPVLVEVAELAARTAVAQGSGADLILALTGRAPLPVGFSVV